VVRSHAEAQAALDARVRDCNDSREHQNLGNRSPAESFATAQSRRLGIGRRRLPPRGSRPHRYPPAPPGARRRQGSLLISSTSRRAVAGGGLLRRPRRGSTGAVLVARTRRPPPPPEASSLHRSGRETTSPVLTDDIMARGALPI